jgi:transcriptional regulator with XRE-family HTH domain
MLAAREHANLSQEEAKLRIGVSRGLIGRWEKGELPNNRYIPKIAEAYGMHPEQVTAQMGRAFAAPKNGPSTADTEQPVATAAVPSPAPTTEPSVIVDMEGRVEKAEGSIQVRLFGHYRIVIEPAPT